MTKQNLFLGQGVAIFIQEKPKFDLEFVRQAVLTIASNLSTGGQWGRLRGLLHRKEHKRLQQVLHPTLQLSILHQSFLNKFDFNRLLKPCYQVVEKQWSDVERRRLEIDEEHLLLLHITDCRLQQINQFK